MSEWFGDVLFMDEEIAVEEGPIERWEWEMSELMSEGPRPHCDTPGAGPMGEGDIPF